MLQKARLDYGINEINPLRSQSIQLALLRAPYRTYLTETCENCKASASLLVYCLPTSVTEYIGSSSEADLVRSKILSGDDSNCVVIVYDSSSATFLGGSTEDALKAVEGNEQIRSCLLGLR